MSENSQTVGTLLAVGAASVQFRIPEEGGKPYALVPNDYSVRDLEHVMPAPIRKRGAIVTTDSPSFIAYLLKHLDADGSVVYAEIDSENSKCNLLAVINDHCMEAPQWRDHTCAFSPKQAIEWKRWLGKDKVKMSQSDFATWLEDNLPDIATVPTMPNGAEILAMALAFEANSDKRLRSKVNLQSGGFTFEFVDKENDATRTTMQVFERFTIGIPVFDGSTSAYPLEARLKYRENAGSVSFWYELIRPDRVFKTAVADEVATIKEQTGLLIVSGVPGL